MESRGNLPVLLWVVIIVCASVLACRWWVVAHRVPFEMSQVQSAVSSAGATNQQSPVSETDRRSAKSLPQLVNINTAGLSELEQLPGIGEVLAGRIIDLRKQLGGFSSIDELALVEGIGEKRLNQLRNLVWIGEPDE